MKNLSSSPIESPKKQETRKTKKWHEYAKNLIFLVQFMRGSNQSIIDLANRIQKRKTTVYAMFKSDDALLSNIERIFNAYDCNIQFGFTNKPKDNTNPNIFIDSNAFVTNSSLEEKYGDKRLYFIRVAMANRGINTIELSNLIESKGYSCTKQTIQHWFNTDNIYISNLYKIADALDADLTIKITKKQGDLD